MASPKTGPTHLFFTLPKVAVLLNLARPIQGDNSRADIAMKRRGRPIADARDQMVFERIDVAIFDMAGVISFVTDQMLPESPLPDAAFAACDVNGAEPFAFWQRPRKTALDEPPAG